jgi:hypothetical protein
MPRSTIRAVTTVGIDIDKNTLHMIGLDSRGAIVLREKVSRGRISLRLANLPPCLIGIEAGMATHYVARELAALGHIVKQVPPTYAKPFRQGHKNDFRDAHAVAEAVQRPTTRFVPAKTDETGSAGPAPGPVSPSQLHRLTLQHDVELAEGFDLFFGRVLVLAHVGMNFVPLAGLERRRCEHKRFHAVEPGGACPLWRKLAGVVSSRKRIRSPLVVR